MEDARSECELLRQDALVLHAALQPPSRVRVQLLVRADPPLLPGVPQYTLIDSKRWERQGKSACIWRLGRAALFAAGRPCWVSPQIAAIEPDGDEQAQGEHSRSLQVNIWEQGSITKRLPGRALYKVTERAEAQMGLDQMDCACVYLEHYGALGHHAIGEFVDDGRECALLGSLLLNLPLHLLYALLHIGIKTWIISA